MIVHDRMSVGDGPGLAAGCLSARTGSPKKLRDSMP